MTAEKRKQIFLTNIKTLDNNNALAIIDLTETYIAEEELDRAFPFLEKEYYEKRKVQLERKREKILKENRIDNDNS